MDINLSQKFQEIYSKTADATYFAPGRVNLIGEHIDYNGGLVMPAAITLGTTLLLAKTEGMQIRFASTNFPETATLNLNNLSKQNKDWYNYPLGAFVLLQEMGYPLGGCDMLFHGNLPIGAGLSSSASIEVLMLVALNQQYRLGLTKLQLVQIAKRIENDFIGVNSGIMDQFAVTFGKKDQAIVLNCDTMEYNYVPCDLGDYDLCIINTNKKRTLADSKYNERVGECNRALEAVSENFQVNALCQLKEGDLPEVKTLISDELIYNRASHVISENERVMRAADALKNKDLEALGEEMYNSHSSLQHLYEVSGKELDTIVDFCRSYEGVIGARMTGAGFGGCAIALVKKDAFRSFADELIKYYTQIIGYSPDVYACQIGNGAGELTQSEG